MAMKSCSMKEFYKHVKKHKKKGMEIKQAVAAAYSELRKVCGVPASKGRMTPKQIVAFGKSESIDIEMVNPWGEPVVEGAMDITEAEINEIQEEITKICKEESDAVK